MSLDSAAGKIPAVRDRGKTREVVSFLLQESALLLQDEEPDWGLLTILLNRARKLTRRECERSTGTGISTTSLRDYYQMRRRSLSRPDGTKTISQDESLPEKQQDGTS